MANNSFSEIAVMEVAQLLYPLKSLRTPESILNMLKRVGYDVPGGELANSFSAALSTTDDVIEAAKTLIEAETDSDKAAAIIPLLVAVKSAFAEFLKLEASIKSAPGLAQDFIDNAPLNELPKRLLNYLIVQNLSRRYPRIYGILFLMGVLEEQMLEEDSSIFQPVCRLQVIRWERLPKYLSGPGDIFDEIYQWKTDFKSDDFLPRAEYFIRAMTIPGGLYKQSDTVKTALGNTTTGLTEIRIPVFAKGTYPETFAQFGLNITPAEAQSGKKKGLALLAYFNGTTEFDFELNEAWEAVFKTTVNIDAGLGLIIRPPFTLDVLQNLFTSPLSAGTLDASLTIQQKKDSNNEVEEIYLFGDKESTHLSVSEISTRFFGSSNASRQDAGAELEIKNIQLLLTTGEGDSFISKIMPAAGIDATFSAGIGFSLLNGIYFKGSAGIEILLPVHIQLGPIEITGINIVAKPSDGEIPIEISSTIKADLGPIQIVVENIGLTSTITFPSGGGGNLGPLDIALGFKPPNGLGLSINAGAVIGGGYLFFDYEKEEYAGVLELTIAGFISAKAIGLITTRMPDGSEGFSMLIIITAEFMPPFQLGYGFTLIGVGGLLGLNRTVLLDPLREGVRTGAVNNIMFPQNVIANAPRIISDLKTIFPPYEGKFLVGPMAKIGWSTPTLISLSLGLIIEIPGNIAILGVLKIVLPEETTHLIRIQVAFAGTIDFDKKMITFDASLYESTILTMVLEGDMSVRFKWGDSPDFIFTVGGFHPSYTPPPLALPTLRRLAINILNTDIAKIRVECYQAVTSNTVQFGARADIHFDLEVCSITGFIGFDALFQFSPFHFIVQVAAGFSLSAAGIDVMSVNIRMSLEGPTPWRAKGTGSVSLLFFDISADFDKTWGSSVNTTLPDIAILPQLILELNKTEQWSSVLSDGKNLSVSLRTMEATGTDLLVLHPAGSLVVLQKLMPLLVSITKVGTQKTSDIRQASISSASSNGTVLNISDKNEDFARAQYQDLTDAEKISKPSFEKMPGGVTISMATGSIQNGNMVRKNIEYEVTIVDKEPAPVRNRFKLPGSLFLNSLKGNSISKSVLSKNQLGKMQPFADKISVEQESYAVAFQADNRAFQTTATFSSEVMAHTFMEDQIRTNPSLKDELHIIPNYELQEL
jgi:hypothetical protein